MPTSDEGMTAFWIARKKLDLLRGTDKCAMGTVIGLFRDYVYRTSRDPRSRGRMERMRHDGTDRRFVDHPEFGIPYGE